MHDARFSHLHFPPCWAQWDELNFYLVQFCSKVVEIWILRTIWPKHYFSNQWMKNTDELKICFIWFSWTVWRGKFFAQKIWKENITKYLYVIFTIFLAHDHLQEHFCTFEQSFGKALTKVESSVVIKQAKNVRFCAISKHSASGSFLPLSKRYLKTAPLPTSKMELAVTIIDGSPIYSKSPVLTRRLQDLSSITHIIVIL